MILETPNPKSTTQSSNFRMQNAFARTPKSKIQNPKSEIQKPKSNIQRPKLTTQKSKSIPEASVADEIYFFEIVCRPKWHK